MTRNERIAAIKHWRQCEMLQQPFFSIKCGSTAMDTTSFGDVIDFLLECAQDQTVKKSTKEQKEPTKRNVPFKFLPGRNHERT